MNVGSCARVMQNFGIYDLKIVQGSSFVFEPTPDDDSSDDDDNDDETPGFSNVSIDVGDDKDDDDDGGIPIF